jgi:hypothetical protein
MVECIHQSLDVQEQDGSIRRRRTRFRSDTPDKRNGGGLREEGHIAVERKLTPAVRCVLRLVVLLQLAPEYSVRVRGMVEKGADAGDEPTGKVGCRTYGRPGRKTPQDRVPME